MNINLNTKAIKNCDILLEQFLPKTGQWRFSAENFEEQYLESNIPFHSTNIDWLQGYILANINSEMLDKYNLTLKEFKGYLSSKYFIEKVRAYQEKIVDFQINYATKHNSSLYGITDKKTYIEKLLKSVTRTLTNTLSMDRDVVKSIIENKKHDIVKMVESSTKIHKDHIGNDHHCAIYCDDVYESLR